MNSVGADIRVRGHVQGVGYRYFCYTKAVTLQLTGWVCNMPDGSVAVHVEGDRGNIEILLADLSVGPYASSVGDVEIAWTKFSGTYHSFSITG
jgi:acylphosphatase